MSEYFKNYYYENKDKFEEYQKNTKRIYCEVCGKSYKWNDYERHLKTALHKRRELKQLKQRHF